MSSLLAVLSYDAVAYLRGCQLLILLEAQRKQSLVDANCTMRRVIVFKTTV